MRGSQPACSFFCAIFSENTRYGKQFHEKLFAGFNCRESHLFAVDLAGGNKGGGGFPQP
jgi:hypothetical protein